METSTKKVVASGVWYTISNFLMKGIVFLTTPIFTRLLTQEEYGLFTNYTSWVSILLVVTTLNVEATLISARYEHEDKLNEYISSVLALSMVSTGTWWLLANLFMEQACVLLDMSPGYMNMMFAYLFVMPAINLYQSRERFFYRYKMSVALSMALSIGASIISVILVLYMNNRLDGRVIGYVMPSILIGGVLLVYLLCLGRKVNISFCKEALLIVLPYIPHLLSMHLLNLMDRIMITKICGERETALYGLAYNVALVITILLSSLNGAFSPWLGEKLSRKEYSSIRETSKWYILLFIYFAIGVMLFSPEILFILGGEGYSDAKMVMVPIALGCICQFIYTLFVNVEQYEKKTVGMAFASMSAAGINFVLNAWLIPIYGYVAASYTTLVGYLWLLLVHMFLVYKMKMSQVYSYKFIWCILFIISVIAILVQLLYTAQFIRYITCAMYIILSLIFAWKYRTKLLSLLKK